MMRQSTRLIAFLQATLAASLLLAVGVNAETPEPAVPVGVSPGAPLDSGAGASKIATTCPTFSWAASLAGPVQLAVFQIPETEPGAEDQSEPVIELGLPAGAISWTPSAKHCLERGRQYVWAVRGVAQDSAGSWSEPMLFEVAAAPSLAEVQAALEVIQASRVDTSESQAEKLSIDETPTGNVSSPAEAPWPALAATPDETGLTAEPSETTGVVVGVLGQSDSQGTGSAGLIGESDAASGEVYGVFGLSASASGAAGVFENTGGGAILAGYNNGTRVFHVDSDGTLHATTFAGPGIGITDVGDLDCPADFSNTFGCVTGSTEIAERTIGTIDLADGSVRSSELREGSVGAAAIAAGAVTADKIVDQSVGTSELATNAVGPSKIRLGGVVSSDIADGGVTNSDLATDTVLFGDLPSGRVSVYGPACADAGALTFDTRCTSVPCGAGFFKNCSGGCTELAPLTCFDNDWVAVAIRTSILN